MTETQQHQQCAGGEPHGCCCDQEWWVAVAVSRRPERGSSADNSCGSGSRVPGATCVGCAGLSQRACAPGQQPPRHESGQASRGGCAPLLAPCSHVQSSSCPVLLVYCALRPLLLCCGGWPQHSGCPRGVPRPRPAAQRFFAGRRGFGRAPPAGAAASEQLQLLSRLICRPATSQRPRARIPRRPVAPALAAAPGPHDGDAAGLGRPPRAAAG